MVNMDALPAKKEAVLWIFLFWVYFKIRNQGFLLHHLRCTMAVVIPLVHSLCNMEWMWRSCISLHWRRPLPAFPQVLQCASARRTESKSFTHKILWSDETRTHHPYKDGAFVSRLSCCCFNPHNLFALLFAYMVRLLSLWLVRSSLIYGSEGELEKRKIGIGKEGGEAGMGHEGVDVDYDIRRLE